MRLIALTLLCNCFISSVTYAQPDTTKWDFENKYFIGSHLITPLANFVFDPSPEYYQLNFGYRLSQKDEISVEAISWTYQGPLGRPYGPDFENPNSGFPGDVKAIGAGLAYKRLLWKGLYGQIHSIAFHQQYRDINKNKIQNGFQLFNSLRLGYHFKLFKKKNFFFAPSFAATFWPINTNLPKSFQIEEDKWPNYFIVEPGFHFGYTF